MFTYTVAVALKKLVTKFSYFLNKISKIWLGIRPQTLMNKIMSGFTS